MPIQTRARNDYALNAAAKGAVRSNSRRTRARP
ncbi:MAG: hypothetical protein ACI8R4_001547, partial [Paracoccaceae bacterium]